MFKFSIDNIVIGTHGEYQTTFNSLYDKHPIPDKYHFIVIEIEKNTIILKYDKIYPKERFNNYSEGNVGILTKRRLKKKNNKYQEGWCFKGITYKYSHEKIIFY
jgi:hypothetical protein